MESFVHLRKGTTPRRIHADLDGLKDDELGRGGFTGRTANMYRRNDPTAYRGTGPDAAGRRAVQRAQARASHRRPAGGPLLMFSNADCRCSLSPAQPSRCRSTCAYIDGDLLCFVHKGTGTARDGVRSAAPTARATGCTSRRRCTFRQRARRRDARAC